MGELCRSPVLDEVSAERRLRARLQQTLNVQDGERMLVPCDGGPSMSRLVRYPPPVEIDELDGTYVLVDGGSPEQWRYEFISRSSS
jgi:hypothetical protein